jgi:vacuolar-type H+-ATPase subunit I/STV1
MRLWEIGGWFLVVLGLFLFYQVFALLVSDRPSLIESGPLTVIGIFVFRGGIHLLKVAAAVQACKLLPAAPPNAGKGRG